MLRTASLPAETLRLLETLSHDSEIHQFTLIGGTALALSWGHRQSEDLDFAYVGFDLPRPSITSILERLNAAGWRLDDISDETARLYQENDGDDLADSQQDWLCRHPAGQAGVKITFFAEYMPAKSSAYASTPLTRDHVRIMPPDGIFTLKSQLLLRRTTLRDLFDLWAFLERGWTIEQILATAQQEDRYLTYEKLRSRLQPARLPATDPGLTSLVRNGPTDLAGINAALLPHLDAYEQRVAAEILLSDDTEIPGGGDPTP